MKKVSTAQNILSIPLHLTACRQKDWIASQVGNSASTATWADPHAIYSGYLLAASVSCSVSSSVGEIAVKTISRSVLHLGWMKPPSRNHSPAFRTQIDSCVLSMTPSETCRPEKAKYARRNSVHCSSASGVMGLRSTPSPPPGRASAELSWPLLPPWLSPGLER